MPRPTPQALFIGGPLDQLVVKKNASGRAPLFRDKEGNSIRAETHYRFLATRPGRGFYKRTNVGFDHNGQETYTYEWSTE